MGKCSAENLISFLKIYKKENMVPIFIISLPRSGSTLLQKILTVHKSINSVSEPWILLPLASMLNRDSLIAEYGQSTCSFALEDLIKAMPRGRTDFNVLTANYIEEIYRIISEDSNAKYFLDKTPRYYYIIPFLREVFPNAKFIFLLRHPLDVLSSIIKTWHGGRINYTLLGNYIDIMRGPKCVTEGISFVGENSLIVNYSELVSSTENVIKGICEYLDIPYISEMVTEYKDVKFSGRMGDKDGIDSYEQVSIQSTENWKNLCATPFRKWYAEKYIKYLGEEVIEGFGFKMNETLEEINELRAPYWRGWSDLFGYITLKIAILLNQICSGTIKIWYKRLKNKPLIPYT